MLCLSVLIQLCIIIPTFNERERLTELVDAIEEVFRRSGIRGEVIIVDDNSPDGTGEVAERLAQRDGVRAVHRRTRLGLGSAVMEGFKEARGDVLGVMDADFSHPPSALPRMLEAMNSGEVDFVVASRYVPGGETVDWPRGRRLMSRLACLLARPLTPVRDATSGFFLVRRSVIDGAETSARGFKICLELLVRGRVSRIAEVPYAFTDRVLGKSKMTVREGARYLLQLRRLFWWRIQNAGHARRPQYTIKPLRT